MSHTPPATCLARVLQHHHLTQLQLSAIERHFYNRQHQARQARLDCLQSQLCWVTCTHTSCMRRMLLVCVCLPVQDCVAKARAALSPQLLSAATAAAAAHSGIEIVEADAGAAAGPPGSLPAAAAAAAAAGAASPAGRPCAAAGFEDRALTRKEEASLLHPLLRLRQACCHPQVRAAGAAAAQPPWASRSMSSLNICSSCCIFFFCSKHCLWCPRPSPPSCPILLSPLLCRWGARASRLWCTSGRP